MKMPWISMKNELPQNDNWVLGLTQGKGIYTIRRFSFASPSNYHSNEWLLPYYVNHDAIFTHWIPMLDTLEDNK